MPYLRTRQGTGFSAKTPVALRVVRALLFFIPDGNPDYEKRLHMVHEWLVECGESGEPWREVGIDKDGTPIVSGPDDRNYGFWCDTNMRWGDLHGEPVTKAEFEAMWSRAAPLRRGEVPSVDDLELERRDPP
jgi:hypothetical protein